ncbi:MAG: lipoprotein insertase outer membrane protein LolB [Rhodanobacteraceae bacterium]
MSASVFRLGLRVFCWGAPVVVFAGLVGCTTPLVKPDLAHLAVQRAREHALAAQTRWRLEGRLAVSDGRNGGSGTFEWRQDGARFRVEVHAPITGRTWTLAGDESHAVLSGVRAEPVEGADAADLLERELGWHVPVEELSTWVRGMRAAGPAEIEFRADGRPAEINQDGWKVRYRDYDSGRNPALPTKIFADHGAWRVRVSVQRWSPR